MEYLGVDGCKAGWLAVGLDQNGNWSATIFSNFESLVEAQCDFELLLIDVPIGLKDSCPEERLCDIHARKILPPNLKQSVFRVPCRKAAYQIDYQKASLENFEHTGKKLSRQVWGIVPRIREVDTFMRSHRNNYIGKIKESHPEVCFHILSSGKIRYPKKSEEGNRERKRILQQILPETMEIITYVLAKYPQHQAQTDDVLDALVLAVTSSMSSKGLSTLPEIPEIDSFDLPMQIVGVRS